MTSVELRGLEVFGHHGVTDEERDRGQVFFFDVEYEVGDAARTDLLEETVDYVEVAERIRAISTARRFSLLEALAGAVADDIVARFPVTRARVRVRKREVSPAGLNVEWTAATVERTR